MYRRKEGTNCRKHESQTLARAYLPQRSLLHEAVDELPNTHNTATGQHKLAKVNYGEGVD